MDFDSSKPPAPKSKLRRMAEGYQDFRNEPMFDREQVQQAKPMFENAQEQQQTLDRFKQAQNMIPKGQAPSAMDLANKKAQDIMETESMMELESDPEKISRYQKILQSLKGK